MRAMPAISIHHRVNKEHRGAGKLKSAESFLSSVTFMVIFFNL